MLVAEFFTTLVCERIVILEPELGSFLVYDISLGQGPQLSSPTPPHSMWDPLEVSVGLVLPSILDTPSFIDLELYTKTSLVLVLPSILDTST